MEAAPEDARFPLGLAGIYEHQKKYEDAIALYEKVLEKSPDNLVAVNNLAVLLSEHRDDEQSRKKAMELALRLADSEQPALQDTLGWIYYQAGDYGKAAEVLSGVVEKAPQVGVFRYHLGMTYYKQGDFRAAREILSKAVAEDQQYDGVDEARRVYAEIRDK
jgi:tetratricopeptide (TPR) repeat protein